MIYLIGFGSSHPNGRQYIFKAYQELQSHPKIQILAQSQVYPNPAFGGKTLFCFFNGAFKIKSPLHPDSIWFLLHSIEIKLGRIRILKNNPRTIDLDILCSSLKKFKSQRLIIPHPEFKKRPFALKPATDIGLP